MYTQETATAAIQAYLSQANPDWLSKVCSLLPENSGIPVSVQTSLTYMDGEIRSNRSLGDLAKQALDVQNACNLSGVVHAWSRSVSHLRKLLPEAGTDALNQHPINVLFADKCVDLAKARDSSTYIAALDECQKLAGGEQ